MLQSPRTKHSSATMVHLGNSFVTATTALAILAIFVASVEAGTTKIAYKKPIYGKTQTLVKEKRLKVKPEVTKIAPTAAVSSCCATTTTTGATISNIIATTTTTPIVNIVGDGGGEILIVDTTKSEEALTIDGIVAVRHINETATEAPLVIGSTHVGETVEIDELFAANIQGTTKEDSDEEEDDEDSIVELPLPIPKVIVYSSTAAPSSATHPQPPARTTTTTTTTESNLPVPCTCGVFLTSQIRRGSSQPPQGKPVIINELDRPFQCNAIGQKQCQTKCLETIVQHLPNSANILCATLDRDCRKERAYLYIKNCRNHWYSTNLAAGREYCCKNGQPYQCPLV